MRGAAAERKSHRPSSSCCAGSVGSANTSSPGCESGLSPAQNPQGSVLCGRGDRRQLVLSARGQQQQGWKQPPPHFGLLNPPAVIFPPSPCRQQPKPTCPQPGFEALTKKSTGYCVPVLMFLLEVPQLLGLLTHIDGQSGPHHPMDKTVSECHRICSRTPLAPDTLPALFPPQYPQKENRRLTNSS